MAPKFWNVLVLELPFHSRAENHRLFLMEQIIFHLCCAALAKQKDLAVGCGLSSPAPGEVAQSAQNRR